KTRKRLGPRRLRLDGDEGIDFVRCRICGDHRRVISGRHLSKHDTDRETYMEEYDLTPDELIAKDFRVIQSSRRGYYPNGKKEWIAAVKNVYEKDGKILPDICKIVTSICTSKAFGFSAIGIRLCMPPDLTQKKRESTAYGTKRKSLRKYALCTRSNCRFTPNM